MERNRHGLPRAIPDTLKRAVRQRDGFGCVICGSAIINYDHHDPPFADALEHSLEGIVLLCPTCHGYVTKGMWSRSKVDEARRNPKAKQAGYSTGLFDVGGLMPYIKLGGVTAFETPRPLCFGPHREAPLLIEPPEDPGGPFRLSGFFYDNTNQQTLIIKQNEWQALTSNWDVEFIGNAITIRQEKGKINLRLLADPPHGIIIDRIDMLYKGHTIVGDRDTLRVDNITFTNSISGYNPCGIAIY